MSFRDWLNKTKRICISCKKIYKPTGTGQRFCKECGVINRKQKTKEYDSSKERKERRRLWDKMPKAKARYKRYRLKLAYKIYSRKRYYSVSENIRKARYYVSNAVRDKRLVRLNYCQICGSKDSNKKRSDIEAHHYKGYEPQFWLEVQWLCVPCHKHAEEVLLGDAQNIL